MKIIAYHYKSMSFLDLSSNQLIGKNFASRKFSLCQAMEYSHDIFYLTGLFGSSKLETVIWHVVNKIPEFKGLRLLKNTRGVVGFGVGDQNSRLIASDIRRICYCHLIALNKGVINRFGLRHFWLLRFLVLNFQKCRKLDNAVSILLQG